MLKKLFSFLLVISILCSMSIMSYAKEDTIKSLENELKKIDFSKELSDEDKETLINYHSEYSNIVFNEEYAQKKLKTDKEKIKSALNKDRSLYVKELDNSLITIQATTQSLGTVGDILVTYSFSSIGIDWGAPGHAAIVHTNSSYTIESFPESDTHADGVRIYTNDWNTKSNVYGVRVSGASYNDYVNAANYAISQADAQKQYNWNFLNKGTTSKFYCSQLVWRAWINQGYDVDRMNLGNYEPVSPAELVGGSNTYVFYYN